VREKVLVAMSGGVDSAVAAALLVEAGYDVTGVFLCLQTDRVSGGNNRSCCSPQDAADARAIASRLGIPFKALSVAEDFAAIIDSFVEDYENGRTPNPCIRCNERVKFGRLFKLADSLGAHRVATGHYARIAERNGVPVIAPAQAGGKDQSYVLFRLPREWLGRILFPVGDLESKQAVREIAGGLGLEVHDKPDSQDVCFVPDGNYTSLRRREAVGRCGRGTSSIPAVGWSANTTVMADSRSASVVVPAWRWAIRRTSSASIR